MYHDKLMLFIVVRFMDIMVCFFCFGHASKFTLDGDDGYDDKVPYFIVSCR